MLITGILLASVFSFDSVWVLPSFAILVILSFLSARWLRLQYACILLSFILLGVWLATYQQESILSDEDYHPRKMEMVVVSELSEKPKTFAMDVLDVNTGRKWKCYIHRDERSRSLSPGVTLVGHVVFFDQHDRFYLPAGLWHIESVSLQHLSHLERSRITFLRWRHRLLERFQLLGAGDDVYAVLSAMTLGDKSALSRDLRDVYSVTGASHVLALSGLHLGILYFFFVCLIPTRWRRAVLPQVFIILSIWAFTFLAGLPVSMIRAALMFSMFAVFSVGEREGASVNTLCLAALIMLVVNPASLYDVGFQLSFMAVISILIVMPFFDGLVSWEWRQHHWLLSRLWDCLAVSTAAQLGVAPLIAFYFGRFSTYFLLTNVVVLPCAYLILVGALIMLLIPWPLLAAGVLWIVGTLNRLLELMARLPFASVEGLHPTVLQVVLCYVALAAFYGALLRLCNVRMRMD
jgi:competence protein ComEC